MTNNNLVYGSGFGTTREPRFAHHLKLDCQVKHHLKMSSENPTSNRILCEQARVIYVYFT